MNVGDSDAAQLNQLVAENTALRAALAEALARVQSLEQLADSDTLTPLPNRRAFIRRLDVVIRHATRHHTPAAVLYIDLDGLKAINDAYGHPVGDAVLIHVAQILTESLRATDMVARIGGDEFGLILDHLNQADASAKAELLIKQVTAAHFAVGNTKVNIRITIGLAMVRTGESVDSLIERADAAMYAKRLYRSQI